MLALIRKDLVSDRVIVDDCLLIFVLWCDNLHVLCACVVLLFL